MPSTMSKALLRFLALACLIPSVFLHAQSSVQFFQGLSFPGGPALVSADFNSDGKLDLATGDAVLLGRGDGTFSAPLPLSVTGTKVVVADFNGDGKADLAIGTIPSPTVSVLITILVGQGDGTFHALQPIYMGTSLSGFDLKTADINTDGKADLVGIVGSNVFVLLGHGDGTFGSPSQYGTGTNPPWQLLPIDVDGDGRVDLVIGCGGYLSVLLGNGDGTFKPPHISNGGDLLAAGDLNGDGKIDLVAEIQSSNILLPPQDYVQLGNGDGTFQNPSNALPLSGPVALRDFDGDGKLDLVLQNTPFASIFTGLGDGTFMHRQDYLLHLDGSSSEIVIADFNNDGTQDIAMSSSILIGISKGMFVGPAAIDFNETVYGAVVGDFNNDGNVDMAIQTGNLTVALGDGSGALFPFYSYNVAPTLVSLATGDLNSDNNLDVVTVVADSSGWSMVAMLGAGDGSFAAPLTSSGGGGAPVTLLTGDFNGDHKIDALVTEVPKDFSGPGSLLMLLGNGDGTFTSPLSVGTNPGPALVSGDFDGDGKLDLAAANPAGVWTLKGNGDGTFQPMILVSSNRAQRLATADLNGDGKLDLLACGLQIYIFLGNGDGTFRALPALNVAGVTLIGDMNGDGKPDVVLSRPPQVGPGTSELDVLLGNGDGSFGAPVKIASSEFGITPLALADFNRDLRTDIAASLYPHLAIFQYPFGGVFTFLNTTGPSFVTSLDSSAMSVSAGQTARTTATITTIGNFAGMVSLTCAVTSSSYLAALGCSVTPPTVSIGPAQHTATATITIPTAAAGMAMVGVMGQWSLLELGSGLTLLLLTEILGRSWSARRRIRWTLMMIALALPILSCGGGRSSNSRSYTLTLTATSGNTVQTTTSTLTIH